MDAEEVAVTLAAMGIGDVEGNGGINKPSEIDEDLHSRQLAVYGRETMRRLSASNVLVSGLQGLGAEIAKNLILAGVKSLTLHDEGVVELFDLSANFLFSEKEVGENRARVSLQKLQEANNSVAVSSLTTELTKEMLAKFQAVVFTNIRLDKAIEFDEYCRNHQPPIAFIKAEVRGLFGSIFCDFGPEFTVVDVDGQDPYTGIIASISNENPPLITCVDDELEIQNGDLVVFSEVCGMTELNDGKPRKVKSARPYSFTLDEDTTKFTPYEKGGIVTQVKQPTVLNFRSLREALIDPVDFPILDMAKIERPLLLHLFFQALDKFVSELGRFPLAGSEQDAQKLMSFVSEINDNISDCGFKVIDQKVLRHFAFGAQAVLSPMAAMFGGITGQEVIKACTGKFHPLFQFFYFDSVESLPSEPLNPSDLKPCNSRYDAQISVFGAKLQRKLEEAKLFVVGSGALGCEFLKNLALMGVSCGSEGKLTITDHDVIKKSNLTSQFIFRDWNIGQSKSTVAATAASSMNPCLRIEALQKEANLFNMKVYNCGFWKNFSAVINAGVDDSFYARSLIDHLCAYSQKPCLKLEILGTKCIVRIFIPNLTRNDDFSLYSPEKQAPMHTLHSFPYNIDHCLTWARSEFEGLFEKTPADVNAYLSYPGEYAAGMTKAGDAQARDTLERVIECLDTERCETFQDCITWARLRFEDYFSNRIRHLTFTFPEDAVTSSGAPFWSAPKRFPRPLEFSVDDQSHLLFVTSASILRADTFGIPIPDWVKSPQRMMDAIGRVIVPDFKPKKDVKIVTDEKETGLNASIGNGELIEKLVARLENCRKQLSKGYKMCLVRFEKDDDCHMDMIVGLANMRAKNYGMPEVDKLQAKFIAGKIKPAIATSRAVGSALACLELYKILDGGHGLEAYRHASVSLTNSCVLIFEPDEPDEPDAIKHKDKSQWGA